MATIVDFTRARAREHSYPSQNLECKQASGDNNYYYTRVRAREETNLGLEMVGEMYLDTLGRPMPAYIQHEVLQLIDSGIQPDMVCAVLAYTAGAPRPSWAYARAVLDKQIAMGARTAADFQGNVSSWRDARAAAKVPPLQARKRTVEQQYDQRHYDPKEYDDIPADQLEEMNRL